MKHTHICINVLKSNFHTDRLCKAKFTPSAQIDGKCPECGAAWKVRRLN